MRDLEYQEQCAIFEWRDYQVKKYPLLELLEGSLNGVKLPIGLAVKAKRQGMLKGSPDIKLPVLMKHGDKTFSGLAIELKVGKNKPTAAQLHILSLLSEQGWNTQVCYGAAAAIRSIKDYLKLKENRASAPGD